MQALLPVSRLIDRLNELIGRSVIWLLLASVVISAINALVRKFVGTSSNAWLEIQWYLFSAVFMLAAGYTFLHNEHVRIDVISGKFSPKGRAWIDIFGILLFLLPFCLFAIAESWPYFAQAYASGEMSGNAGGLILWPAYLLIPIGFALLALQAVSELIKRLAFIAGLIPDPTERPDETSAEQDLAKAILEERAELKGEQR